MSIRRKLTLTLATALLIGVVLAPAAGATQLLGGFSVHPAEFNPADPVTRAYFKPAVPAGGTFTGNMVVANPGPAPLHLLVYPVDGLTSVDGGAVYGNRQTPLRSAGTWVTTAVSNITVPAGTEQLVGFTVNVPHTAQPGDHLAGIAFENADPVRTRGQFSITEVLRVVVGVEVIVPGPAKSALQVTSAALKPLPGTKLASVVVGLDNSGGLVCKPQLAVSLRGTGPARVVTRKLDTILPGDAIDYPQPWPYSLPSGGYDVSIRSTGCGAPDSLTATLHLGKHLRGTTPSAPAQRPIVETVIPWWLLVIAGACGLIGVLGLTLPVYARRRRRRRIRARRASIRAYQLHGEPDDLDPPPVPTAGSLR